MLRLRSLRALIGLAALFAISCSGSLYGNGNGNGSKPGTGNSDGIYDYYFEFSPLTITAGTTVTWTNHGMMTHTVTSASALFDSGDLVAGATFTHTFATPGTYTYYCKYHGTATSGMMGTVIVN